MLQTVLINLPVQTVSQLKNNSTRPIHSSNERNNYITTSRFFYCSLITCLQLNTRPMNGSRATNTGKGGGVKYPSLFIRLLRLNRSRYSRVFVSVTEMNSPRDVLFMLSRDTHVNDHVTECV